MSTYPSPEDLLLDGELPRGEEAAGGGSFRSSSTRLMIRHSFFRSLIRLFKLGSFFGTFRNPAHQADQLLIR